MDTFHVGKQHRVGSDLSIDTDRRTVLLADLSSARPIRIALTDWIETVADGEGERIRRVHQREVWRDCLAGLRLACT